MLCFTCVFRQRTYEVSPFQAAIESWRVELETEIEPASVVVVIVGSMRRMRRLVAVVATGQS